MSPERVVTSVDAEADLAFREFADRLVTGESGAAHELLARYAAQLVAVARRRLGPRLRSKEDPEDVVQSVLRTFFRRLDSGEVDLRGWGSLWELLSLMTLRKCQRREERYHAGRRDVTREVSAAAEPGRLILSVPERAPSPEEAAVFGELVEELFRGLSERDRAAVEGLLVGDSTCDVAGRLGCSERTVQRILLRVRQRFGASLEDASAGG